ncbi:hypothetical protein SCBWM1_gp13 [Synechococcus phage S-CBWM1]|uniref:Uncharacterized protein n=1 Tax=Synechococcus phage S-CBWM1 TaxID=2053653 RepID=A0A3G1L3D4_9CAUD|nr:hypothetical protein HOU61_gp014 [Synechococcus phage S-CBWM1]ATW62697.1 hypothetical protein SCBWM1_gp13 [Synechococcus phage S-CBWM1]
MKSRKVLTTETLTREVYEDDNGFMFATVDTFRNPDSVTPERTEVIPAKSSYGPTKIFDSVMESRIYLENLYRTSNSRTDERSFFGKIADFLFR